MYADQLRSIDDPQRSVEAMCEQRVACIEQQLQRERSQLVQTVSWICVMSTIILLALTFASLTLVFALWESARVPAVGALALLYSSLGFAFGVSFKKYLGTQGTACLGTNRSSGPQLEYKGVG